MRNMNELEQYFLQDINRQSDVEIERLKQEQKAVQEKAILEIQRETQKEAKTVLDQELNELTLEYTVKNSKITEQQNRKLMLKREALTAKLFQEVEHKLHVFVASEEYVAYLQEQVKALALDDEAIVFYIRKEDEKYGKDVFQLHENVQVKIDPNIKIGGFRMENEQAGIVVDETFDSRLEDEKKWFYANSSLSIR